MHNKKCKWATKFTLTTFSVSAYVDTCLCALMLFSKKEGVRKKEHCQWLIKLLQLMIKENVFEIMISTFVWFDQSYSFKCSA